MLLNPGIFKDVQFQVTVLKFIEIYKIIPNLIIGDYRTFSLCPEDSFHYKGYCYKVFVEKESFSNAEVTCSLSGYNMR